MNLKKHYYTLTALGLFLLLGGCVKLNVDQHLLAPSAGDEALRKANQGVEIQVHWTGENWERDDWAKAMPSSRLKAAALFSRGMENETGSLRDLLEPPMGTLLLRKGYSLRRWLQGKQSKGLVLELTLEQADLVWTPPQEFIKSPKTRKVGEIRLDYRVRCEIKRGGIPVWTRELNEKRVERTLPGNEGLVMSLLSHQVLKGFVETLEKELPVLSE